MDRTRKIITKSAAETSRLAEGLAANLREGRGNHPNVLCLYGELGSGKTTFVQGFARGLGLTGRLLSPTYIIVRRYQLESPLHYFYHLDLYRMNEAAELAELGIQEILADPTNFVAIEWAGKLGALLPTRRVDVHFENINEEGHGITIDHLM